MNDLLLNQSLYGLGGIGLGGNQLVGGLNGLNLPNILNSQLMGGQLVGGLHQN